MEQNQIFVGGSDAPVYLNPAYANRHGLIAGATGTGKTVTLQILAEQFSRIGVPVFLSDVKGDLAGLSQSGTPNERLDQRASQIGLDPYEQGPSPCVFWDLFGRQGHPIRTTVSEMGPLLLSRLMELNETQEGVLNIAFRVADDEGMLLLDLEDLRAIMRFVSDQSKALSAEYGNVSKASVGAIQRRLLVLEEQGAKLFFGEPALELQELMRSDLSGRGIINVLASDELFQSPRLYSTFLLWLLSELFEELPEVGDPDKPKLVFFFDEAHLLFDDAPKALIDKVEQVVRLIRSKGVGIFFVSQNPLDLPDEVLGQLGNRVQHALRAFTRRDQKAVRAAATTFRENPKLDTETVITQMGVGEALVSTLQKKGVPGVVQRCLIRPPASRMGPISDEERSQVRSRSPVGPRYDKAIDRESAAEILERRAAKAAAAAEKSAKAAETSGKAKKSKGRSSSRQSYGEAVSKSVLRSLGSQFGRGLGQKILRGILGSLSKGR